MALHTLRLYENRDFEVGSCVVNTAFLFCYGEDEWRAVMAVLLDLQSRIQAL